MPLRYLVPPLLLALAGGCDGERLAGGPVANYHDIDDVTGGESTLQEREIDVAEDASESGVVVGDDGSVRAGDVSTPGDTVEAFRGYDRREAEEAEMRRDVEILQTETSPSGEREVPDEPVLPPPGPAAPPADH